MKAVALIEAVGDAQIMAKGRNAAVVGVLAMIASAALSSAAPAQSPATPKNWNYELHDGKRVPRTTNRVATPDGGWREEVQEGSCMTVRQMSKNGEYKETRQCNPAKPH